MRMGLLVARESAKIVLRIIFAYLLQKFDQELTHETVELKSGVIEVRGCHPVTKQVLFVYLLNKNERTERESTSEVESGSSFSKNTVSESVAHSLYIA